MEFSDISNKELNLFNSIKTINITSLTRDLAFFSRSCLLWLCLCFFLFFCTDQTILKVLNCFFLIYWLLFSRKRKSTCLVWVCEVRENSMYVRFKSGKPIYFLTKKPGKTCFLARVMEFVHFSCRNCEWRNNNKGIQ